MPKFLFAVLSALALLSCAPAAAQIVKVDGGLVRGKTFDGRRNYLPRNPFAAPPVEDLRWKPPQPVIPWKRRPRSDRSARLVRAERPGLEPFAIMRSAAKTA